jgi:Fic family protein
VTKLSPPTIAAALEALQKAEIIREITGRKRNRLYAYKKYLDLMKKETEP